MTEINTLEEALSVSGFLEKKSPTLFVGYQKRWFAFYNPTTLSYFKHENSKNKGSIDLKGCVLKTKDNNNKLYLVCGERTFKLKAKTNESFKMWFNALSFVLSKIETKDEVLSNKIEEVKKTEMKINFNFNINVKGPQPIKQMKNDELIFSKKMLQTKGYQSFLSKLDQKMCNKRVIHGVFHKSYSQPKPDHEGRKWIFLISQFPLTEEELLQDDFSLDTDILPNNIKYNTLYYYNCNSEEDDSPYLGKIEVSDFIVEKIEQDDLFILKLQTGAQDFILLKSFTVHQRDKWFEALKTVKKTYNLIHRSTTKKPANLEPLFQFIKKNGQSPIRSFIVNQKERILGKFVISQRDDFANIILKIKKFIFSVIDASLIHSDDNYIISNYLSYYNEEYLHLLSDYLLNSKNTTPIDNLDLGCLLLRYQEDLNILKIKDSNLNLNGKTLIKNYFYQSFHRIRDEIPKIIKNELLVNPVKSTDTSILITNGPIELFNHFYKVLEEIDKIPIKCLLEYSIKIFKELIFHYLNTIDYITNRYDIRLSKEIVIAFANNTVFFNNHLNELIVELENSKLMTRNEIEERFNHKMIIQSTNIVSSNAITRLVNMLYNISFDSVELFLELDVDKLTNIIIEDYNRLTMYLQETMGTKLMTKVLQSCIYQYVKLLLLTGNRSLNNFSILLKKIEKDEEIFLHKFGTVLGKIIIEDKLKILDYFRQFMNSNFDNIAISCEELRKYAGVDFSINIAFALIELRVDLHQEHKNKARQICINVFNSVYVEDKSKSNSMLRSKKKRSTFFSLLDTELNIEDQVKSHNSTIEYIKRKTVSLDFYLNLKEQKEEIWGNKLSKDKFQENYVDPETIYSGELRKKDSQGWTSNYFILKNNFLIWLENDKSMIMNNLLNMKDIYDIVKVSDNEFKLYSKYKTFDFICESIDNRDEWIEQLKSCLVKEESNSLQYLYENDNENNVMPRNKSLIKIFKDKLYAKNTFEKLIETEKFLKRAEAENNDSIVFDSTMITTKLEISKKNNLESKKSKIRDSILNDQLRLLAENDMSKHPLEYEDELFGRSRYNANKGFCQRVFKCFYK